MFDNILRNVLYCCSMELQMKLLVFVPSAQLIFLLGFLIPTLCINQSKLHTESEKAALLEFKDSLRDPHSLLSSWEGSDCRNWRRISCDNETEHVVSLDLGYLHLFDGPSTTWRLSGFMQFICFLLYQFYNFQIVSLKSLQSPLRFPI